MWGNVMIGFWIFMLIMNLLIPCTMIGFGVCFIKSGGSNEINGVFGYRTSMSMKNKETWEFAHNYCGKLWRFLGGIMLPLSIAAMLFVLGKETQTVGMFGGMLSLIQCVFLLLPIIPTEKALRKNFDKNGNRIV